jgi:hypothetical protein
MEKQPTWPTFHFLPALARRLDGLLRIQAHQSDLPGDGGIDNLPELEPRQPESKGCLSGLLSLFTHLGRKK